MEKVMRYLKNNQRIAENISSYITMLVGLLGLIMAEKTGILTLEIIIIAMIILTVLNRVLTNIHVSFLKKEIKKLKKETKDEFDDFVME